MGDVGRQAGTEKVTARYAAAQAINILRRSEMSRRKIFLCVMAASVFINAVILVIMILCGNTPGFTVYSFYIAPIAIIYYVGGVVLYFRRHPKADIIDRISEMKVRKDRLEVPRTLNLGKNFDPEMYLFTWQFCLYWFEAPFFINIMLFAKSELVALLIVPLLLGQEIIMTVVSFRAGAKILDERYNRVTKELEEQKKREEMGHMK